MIADGIRFTHSGSGGAGALTAARITGDAMPSDVWGSSGTVPIDYTIVEYTDSSKAVRLQWERGSGEFNLATGSLARASVLATWVAATPAYNLANPSALTFGSTAANIDIIVAPSTTMARPALPAVHAQSSVGNEQYVPVHMRMQIDSGASGLALSAGYRFYIPVEFAYGKKISSVAVNAASVTVTGNVRIGVYEWGADGMPGNLITEFTAGGAIGINTATGMKSLTLSTPLYLPPGWYYFMIVSDANVQLLAGTPAGHCGMGSNNSRDIMYMYKSASYGAAPSTGDASMSGSSSRSAGGQPIIYVK